FFQAEDGIRDDLVTGVQTCALPISFLSAAAFCRCSFPEESARARVHPWLALQSSRQASLRPRLPARGRRDRCHAARKTDAAAPPHANTSRPAERSWSPRFLFPARARARH